MDLSQEQFEIIRRVEQYGKAYLNSKPIVVGEYKATVIVSGFTNRLAWLVQGPTFTFVLEMPFTN